MSDYHLVTDLHAARVTLTDARKVGNAADVAAADAEVAAARAAVNAALADWRLASAKHLLDLDLDSLGAILSHLGPKDALSTSHTCTTLRSALFRGGLPGPLAAVCLRLWWRKEGRQAAAALSALDDMEPALGAQWLSCWFHTFGKRHARLLARALDKAPRAARIDIKLFRLQEAQAGRLAAVLTSPDRALAAPPQVYLSDVDLDDAGAVLRLTRAGVCVVSIEQSDYTAPLFFERVAANAANTLTQLKLASCSTLSLTTRFPVLRRLILDASWGFTTDVPSLTALAPHLKEIEFNRIDYSSGTDNSFPPHGFGFEPRRFARFVAAIQGVTRVHFRCVGVTLSQNENENLGQLAALRTLRDLEISCWTIFVELDPPSRDLVAEDAIMSLPPLPPGLTRLAFSCRTRVAFGHPLPQLRVLDWRGSLAQVFFNVISDDERHKRVEQGPDVPLAIPSAAIAPNLHTLLISYVWCNPPGDFDLWTLVAARTALRVVFVEHARLLCSAPEGFETTTAGFAAVLAREAKDLMSVHSHGCEIEGGHQLAVENFFSALKERGGRVCRAGPTRSVGAVKVDECLFCMLHDGSGLWRQWC